MIGGFVSGLLAAWILSLFDVHVMLLEVLQPLISVQLTASHYYILGE